jgi:hypothetical protein
MLLLFGGGGGAVFIAAPSITIASTGRLALPAPLAATATVSLSIGAGNISAPGPLAGAATVSIGAEAAPLRAGASFAAAATISVSVLASTGVSFNGAASLTLSTDASLSVGAATMSAASSLRVAVVASWNEPLTVASTVRVAALATLIAPVRFAAAASITIALGPLGIFALLGAHPAFAFEARASMRPAPRETLAFITLGEVDVTGKVRKAGISIRDILNDAPNTAALTFEGTAIPEVGLPLRIGLDQGRTLLFSGALQTVDRSYEGGLGKLRLWPCTAIDDTAAANRRRPFGSWIETSASVIAASLAASYAPGFATRIEAALPLVTVSFDGSETMIAALVRLANLVGGYAKVEDRTLHLFIEDPSELPDPVNETTHRPLNDPPASMSTDSSQMRTRVYGRGYGENVPTDVGADETLLPIQDGVQFTALGGQAIAGTTAESAQSQIIRYGGVSKPLGGTLVGPGAMPSNAPTLALMAGGVCTNGLHEVAVVHVTAAGKSLVGPRGSILIGPIAPPTAYPSASAPLAGTGPDEGDHAYTTPSLAVGAETTPGPASNVVHTSASFGQIAAPGAPTVGTPVEGSGVDVGYHDYVQTYVNADGETQAGGPGNQVYNGTIVGGVPNPTDRQPPVPGTPQIGAGVDSGSHTYAITFVTAEGETMLGSVSNPVSPIENAGQIAIPSGAMNATPNTPLAPGNLPDNIRRYYRCTYTNAVGETETSQYWFSDPPALPDMTSHPGNNNATTGGSLTPSSSYRYWLSAVTASGYETAISNYVAPSLGAAQNAVEFTSLTKASDPRVVARKLYRTKAGQVSPDGSHQGGFLVATINDNTTTYFKDTMADSALNAGTAYYVTGSGGNPVGPRGTGPGWQARVFNLPIGPAGVTGRKLYRSSDMTGPSPYKLIATIADNVTAQYIDNIAPASEGAIAPGSGQNTTGQPAHQIPLSNIPTGFGGSGVTQRKLYRNSAGGGWRLVDTIPNNTATVYTDTKPNQQLGANPPTVNGTGRAAQNLPVTIWTGPAGVTKRRLFRRFYSPATGFTGFKLVTAINDNSTTSYLDTKSNSSLGEEAPTSNTTGTAQQRVPITNIPLGPPGSSGRNLYRSSAGQGWRLLASLGTSQTSYTDATPNSGLGAAAPGSNTATGNQIGLSQIPTGGAQVIMREIYMTRAGGAALYLALQIADNTTRDGVLNIADASLTGAAPPTTDTSGLTQPTGQVNPGSTTLIVASPAPFSPTGGWVVTGGGQVLRYYGISGQLLTGIPGSGAGAILTTILYGQQALPCPTLTGVTGLTKPMGKGAAVHIWVERNDLLAQTEQAARDGSDGIIEYVLTDERRSEPSLITRCDADLALFSRPIITVTYATRDTKTKSGKRVRIILPSLSIDQELTIQDVAIAEIDIATGLAPRFSVTASSVRFSLEDTLRRLITI